MINQYTNHLKLKTPKMGYFYSKKGVKLAKNGQNRLKIAKS